MWQRFTERVRRVVFFAQEEAGLLGDNYVSTEHLLLGLLRESDCVAARILNRMGYSLDRIRLEVTRHLGQGTGHQAQDMQLTPRAKRVVDLSYEEARKLNNNYIGTEHLLLALVHEGEGLAGRVLVGMGINLEQARQEVKKLQESEPPVGPVGKISDATQSAIETLRGVVNTMIKSQAATVEELRSALFSEEEISSIPQVGDLGVLQSSEEREVVEVAVDELAFRAMQDVFQARDAYGYRELVSAETPRVLRVANGTGAKLLGATGRSNGMARRVRILDGDYAGQVVYVAAERWKRVGADESVFPPEE